MRTLPGCHRVFRVALSGLALALAVTGCPKRQDGLVFEETNGASNPPKASSASNASKKPKKGGTAKKAMMYGRVVDRNDVALKRVTILVSPGNTELISNKWGEYEIDQLHSEDGSRVELKRGQDYTINAWKPGFHETTQIFRYDGDVAELPTITLIEDSIKLDPQDSTPMIPVETNDEAGPGAVGKSVENE